MSPRLEFAIDTAFRAGRSTLALFQGGAEVMFKEDETPVTLADREAERIVRELIAAKYPAESILGEEEGGNLAACDRWVVDPIDGTKSFICGVPLYATLLSYEVDGEPEIGVCYLPALDEMLYAERGKGAFVNGRPAHVSNRKSSVGAVIAVGGSMIKSANWPRVSGIIEKALATRTWGDAYGHSLVATGRVDAMIDPIVSHWDISAISLIVREAGGRFSDLQGNERLANEGLSTNGFIHDELVTALRQ